MSIIGAFVAFMFLVYEVYKLKERITDLEEKVRKLDKK